MSMISELFICLFLILGGIFCLSGSVGLFRFPDIYCKLQALSKPVTLGIFCLIIAYILFLFYTEITVSFKGILAIIFLLMSVPIGTHMIVKAAYRSGAPLWEKSLMDELADMEFHVHDDSFQTKMSLYSLEDDIRRQLSGKLPEELLEENMEVFKEMLTKK